MKREQHRTGRERVWGRRGAGLRLAVAAAALMSAGLVGCTRGIAGVRAWSEPPNLLWFAVPQDDWVEKELHEDDFLADRSDLRRYEEGRTNREGELVDERRLDPGTYQLVLVDRSGPRASRTKIELREADTKVVRLSLDD